MPQAFSRRVVLGGTLATALAGAWRGRSALADALLRPGEANSDDRVLVSLFLRGGADGLNIVPPFSDDGYLRSRPTIGLAVPGKSANAALDLDGFFGLHPALAPLLPLYKDGLLALVHAAGSGDQSRSHFAAMAAMERGLADDKPGAPTGWLGRYLAIPPPGGGSPSPLRAVAFSSTLPDALRGWAGASALDSLADFRLDLPRPAQAALAALYNTSNKNDAVTQAGRETLRVLNTLRRLDAAHYRPARGARYPASALGEGLKQTACLIKGRVGLEIACLDRGGWDTHVGQGGATGWLALQLADVAQSLAAFAVDLGGEALSGRVTIVVQTEFGRRVGENSGLGTDHGRASVMLLAGAGVRGGRVFARWPGVAYADLEPPGDLRVTTDYRDVLAEVVSHRLSAGRSAEDVFPGFTPRPVGIVAPLI